MGGFKIYLCLIAILITFSDSIEPQKPHYLNGEHQENFDKTAIHAKVNELIADNKVMMFSKSYCPYCKKAKHILESIQVDYSVVEIDLDPNGAEIQHFLLLKSNQRTVPNIFINHKHFGGADRTVEAFQSGELFKLLDDAGVLYTKPKE